MSELSDLLAGITVIKLRQSRAIARAIDRQRAVETPSDDIGYDFAVAIAAAATDRSPAEIEELGGSILDLSPGVTHIIELAGFRPGEAPPAASPSIEDSSGSTPPLLPATVTPRRRSAR